MIERKFVAQKFKEYYVKEYIKSQLNRAGLSNVKLQRTSMGEKILVTANKPGMVVGRGGSVIQQLTKDMKNIFKLENPQIEIVEISDADVDANVIGEFIVNQLERFGSQRFKGIAHKILARVMNSGALGVEIVLSGKIPSARAKSWRFAEGYMKKCGDVAITGVNIAKTFANLKTGIVGVQVRIMPPTTKLPDDIKVGEHKQEIVSNEPKVEKEKPKKRNKKTNENKKRSPKKSVQKEETKVEKKQVKEDKKETKENSKTEKTETEKTKPESKNTDSLKAENGDVKK